MVKPLPKDSRDRYPPPQAFRANGGTRTRCLSLRRRALFHVSYIRIEARIGIEPMHYSGCNRAPFRLGYRAMLRARSASGDTTRRFRACCLVQLKAGLGFEPRITRCCRLASRRRRESNSRNPKVHWFSKPACRTGMHLVSIHSAQGPVGWPKSTFRCRASAGWRVATPPGGPW
jgi:hypothetical protein